MRRRFYPLQSPQTSPEATTPRGYYTPSCYLSGRAGSGAFV